MLFEEGPYHCYADVSCSLRKAFFNAIRIFRIVWGRPLSSSSECFVLPEEGSYQRLPDVSCSLRKVPINAVWMFLALWRWPFSTLSGCFVQFDVGLHSVSCCLRNDFSRLSGWFLLSEGGPYQSYQGCFILLTLSDVSHCRKQNGCDETRDFIHANEWVAVWSLQRQWASAHTCLFLHPHVTGR